MPGPENALRPTLDRLRASHLYRRRRTVTAVTGKARVEVDGRRLIEFCSNDYLGLARDPRVVAALSAAGDRWGFGSTAAHLVTGHSSAHHTLEEDLAHFTGRPRALLFSTGYMANLGVLTALAGRGDLIVEDRLNHASLIDGRRRREARRPRRRRTAADRHGRRVQYGWRRGSPVRAGASRRGTRRLARGRRRPRAGRSRRLAVLEEVHPLPSLTSLALWLS